MKQLLSRFENAQKVEFRENTNSIFYKRFSISLNELLNPNTEIKFLKKLCISIVNLGLKKKIQIRG